MEVQILLLEVETEMMVFHGLIILNILYFLAEVLEEVLLMGELAAEVEMADMAVEVVAAVQVIN